MPKFSAISLFRLQTCHPDLVTLFQEVIKVFDCTVLEGYRGQAQQEAAFAAGKTKLHYPNGKHNAKPSMAADVAPYPVNFTDTKRFYYFAGVVMGIAERLRLDGKMAHKVRWGGDWDLDNQVLDQDFNDLLHYEIIAPFEIIT